ncbi:hypothetical protein D0864_03078 [Hortaea werneckii]|uniref:YDG domain-containing protein n=1 Tax=Hortaea werneckii TaxID=91943 RepID=A0A3M7GP52_HORWE|nr:hypothetical protein KC338_g2326 [Hortaea werneckii]KAI7274191.1 hypothetical protein KC352_g8008 [Hortaea werneckii]KAI7357423.1 hypothetical protein KC320_g1761 [Hortaea werneckii]KAI7569097.1 hypothetical protein KC317_g3616 [Hortaea werneckii]KAI7623404.1 hypothetical protein KC346_g2758 [Hortaea werneckii]
MGNEGSKMTPEEQDAHQAAHQREVDAQIEAHSERFRPEIRAEYARLAKEKRERLEREAADKQAESTVAKKPQLVRSSKSEAVAKPRPQQPIATSEDDGPSRSTSKASSRANSLSAVHAADATKETAKEKDALAGWEARKSRLSEVAPRADSDSTRSNNITKSRPDTDQGSSTDNGEPSRAAPAAHKRHSVFGDERGATTSKPRKTSAASVPQSTGGTTTVNGVSSLGRIPKKSIDSNNIDSGSRRNSNNRPGESENLTALSTEPPEWYQALKPSGGRVRGTTFESGVIAGIKDAINKAKLHRGSGNVAGLRSQFETLSRYLHKAPFMQVTGQLLRDNRVLHKQDGLQQIFDPEHMAGVPYPEWLQADARELYNKWRNKNFETNIFWGLEAGRAATRHAEGRATTIDWNAVNRVSCDHHGNESIVNGQWWPLQLCLLRDGAHGQSQQGIHGKKGHGAFSCVIAGGLAPDNQPYPNIDEGDIVYYCGTDSNDGSVTEGTSRLIESKESGKPIRLIRSHNLKNEYAPEKGFRYDGLYTIVNFEMLDPPNSKRQRHRFKMVRVPGQPPMRGTGEGKRPTKEELEQLELHRNFSGFAG